MTWVIPVTKVLSTSSRKMPRQKPGQSEQTVGTPWDFIGAVERRFGPLTVDLASDKKNAKAPVWISPEENTFKVKWARAYSGNMWLNPEFGNIKPYAAKCAKEALRLGSPAYHWRKDEATNARRARLNQSFDRILLLIPASIGTHYYWDHIHGKARVLVLSPRLTFVGHRHAFPKDLILCVYGEKPGLERWIWKENRRTA